MGIVTEMGQNIQIPLLLIPQNPDLCYISSHFSLILPSCFLCPASFQGRLSLLHSKFVLPFYFLCVPIILDVIFVWFSFLLGSLYPHCFLSFHCSTSTGRTAFFSPFFYGELASLRSVCELYCTTLTQKTFTGSTPTIESLEKAVKYVQN